MSDPRWVPIAEAAAQVGVTDRTVRRWARAGHLTLYRKGGRSGPGGPSNGPQVYVDLEELQEERRRRERLGPVR